MFYFTEPFFRPIGNAYMKPAEMKKSVAIRIASILKAKGWSNNQLGREAGLPKSFISSIMSGMANPTLETIAKLETALQTPIIRVLRPKGERKYRERLALARKFEILE